MSDNNDYSWLLDDLKGVADYRLESNGMIFDSNGERERNNDTIWKVRFYHSYRMAYNKMRGIVNTNSLNNDAMIFADYQKFNDFIAYCVRELNTSGHLDDTLFENSYFRFYAEHYIKCEVIQKGKIESGGRTDR